MKATMSGWSKEEEPGRRRGSPEGSRKIMRVQKQKKWWSAVSDAP